MSRAALVLGSNGWIGQRLTARLRAAGWSVLGFDRTEAGPNDKTRCVTGDRYAAADLQHAVELCHTPPVVFDTIAYDSTAPHMLETALAGRIRRVVMLSTVSVYSALRDAKTTEARAVLGTDTGPSYQAGKRRAEHALNAARHRGAFETVILRSPPVFGPGDQASREAWLLRRLSRGAPIVHPGPLNGRALMIYVDDLIGALVAAGDGPACAGRTYHLAHARCPTLADHAAHLADLAHLAAPDWHIRPAEQLVRSGYRLATFPFALCPEQTLDIRAAVDDLGLRSTDMTTALRATLEAIDQATPWPGAATMQAHLSGTTWLLHEGQDSAGEPANTLSLTRTLDLLEGAVTDLPLVTQAQYDTAPKASGAPTQSTPVVVVPPDWPGASNATGPARPIAVAHLVDVNRADRSGSLFHQTGANPPQDYAHDATPCPISWKGFARAPRFQDLRDGPPLFLKTDTPEDAAALCDWSRSCAAAGIVSRVSLGALARVRLPGHTRPDGTGTDWSDLFTIARLLARLDSVSPQDTATLQMHLPPPDLTGAPFLPLTRPWALVSLNEQALLIETRAGRILTLSPRMAALAKAALTCLSAAECLTQFAEAEGLEPANAVEAMVQGIAQLSAFTGVVSGAQTPTGDRPSPHHIERLSP